jgi:putative DNA primase/helicase
MAADGWLEDFQKARERFRARDEAEAERDAIEKEESMSPGASLPRHVVTMTAAPRRQTIVVDPARMDLAADAAIEVLRETECVAEDRLYSRGGVLVRIRRDRAKLATFKDSPDPPTIAVVELSHLARYRLPLVADFVHVNPKRSAPFVGLAQAVLSIDAVGFTRLTAITTAPVLRPDGTILLTPGYDEATGLFYVPEPSFQGFAVPDRPTADDVRRAVGALHDVYGDFAWKDEKVDLAAAISFPLSLFARSAIRGNVPIHAVTAPSAGSGKTTAIDVGANIYFGCDAPRWDAPRNEDEEKKSILALAVGGQPCVLADNHPEGRPFGSAEISKAITGDKYQGRILGHTNEVVVPMRAVWAVTGNNLSFKDTVGRRVVLSRIDTDLEDPTTREYVRPDLLDYVRSKRPELAWSILVLLRAHVLAGIDVDSAERKLKPSVLEWDRWVRGALLRAGLGDPDGAKDEIATELDTDRESLGGVLHALGVEPFSTSGLIKRSAEDPALRQALEGALRGREVNGNSVGVLLRSLKDRPCAGLVLRKEGRKHGAGWLVLDHPESTSPRGVESTVDDAQP